MEKDQTLESVLVAEHQASADGEKGKSPILDPDVLSRENAEKKQEIEQEEQQYVTGFKFAIVMVSLTLVFFLVMLDLSIITTVSEQGCSRTFIPKLCLTVHVGYSTYHERLPFFA